ncbi:MAG: thiamine phosphate synthase [Chloroflexi bacterium]|nr:thiamine phosphate synthase [Chloroflexota bacterium]TDI87476.1 MAG: thiamine phosphate synthase [Chloroflexota bacterium]
MTGIYVIVDPEHTNGRSVVDVAGAAFESGASVVQLRDKLSPRRQIAECAVQIQNLAHHEGKLFIVNDHADIARIIGADGLHVGQNDLRVEDCRLVLDDRQLVGTSNALLSEAEESQRTGADYLAVGAIFTTSTKTDTRPAGLDTLRAVRESCSIHVVAIGGINASNLVSVMEAGANSICIATAITMAADIGAATSELVDLFERANS